MDDRRKAEEYERQEIRFIVLLTFIARRWKMTFFLLRGVYSLSMISGFVLHD